MQQISNGLGMFSEMNESILETLAEQFRGVPSIGEQLELDMEQHAALDPIIHYLYGRLAGAQPERTDLDGSPLVGAELNTAFWRGVVDETSTITWKELSRTNNGRPRVLLNLNPFLLERFKRFLSGRVTFSGDSLDLVGDPAWALVKRLYSDGCPSKFQAAVVKILRWVPSEVQALQDEVARLRALEAA